MADRQIVVRKEDHKVLRFGFCNFEVDGNFDPTTELIQINNTYKFKDLREYDYYIFEDVITEIEKGE